MLVGLANLGDIGLRHSHDLRSLRQFGIEALEFTAQRLVVAKRIASLGRIERHEMEKRATPLHVFEKSMPEPRALCSPRDEARDIREDERSLIAHANDAQVRRERRERIVGDLGLSPRHGPDERRLADIGEPEKTDVRHDLELEAEMSLLPRFARLGASGGAVVRRCEVNVPPSALAALRDDHSRARLIDVKEELVRVTIVDLRSHRNAHDELFRGATVTVGTLTVAAMFTAKRAAVGKIEKRRETFVRDEDDICAPSSISARRAPERHEFFASERDDTVASATGDEINTTGIDELHGSEIVEPPPGGQL